MIRLNVFIAVEEQNKLEVINLAKELVSNSLKEDGCIAYDIFESSTRGGVLMICETWRDEQAIAAHNKTAHFTTLLPKIEALSKLKLESFNF